MPKLLEEFFFCGNSELCRRVAEVFELKNANIKNEIFPKLIEQLCKKAESLKFTIKNEIDCLIEKINDLEKNEALKCEEIRNKMANFHSRENDLVNKLENEITTLKEAVKKKKERKITIK